jgi:hypothetical protein
MNHIQIKKHPKYTYVAECDVCGLRWQVGGTFNALPNSDKLFLLNHDKGHDDEETS